MVGTEPRQPGPLIDVLMCVGERDVRRLMAGSLQSCLAHFSMLNRIVVVTSAKADVLCVLDRLDFTRSRIEVLDDREVIPAGLLDWPGWCKQQYIRLHADLVCETPTIACLSADTLIFKPITREHLFLGPKPILFYNRYPHTTKHLLYERRRVENIARLLRVRPEHSWRLGDFIMDLTLFESGRLRELRRYLANLYGDEPFLRILPRRCDTLEEKTTFGEWTLYAVFMLDVLKARPPLRNSRNQFIAQVHSAKELADFPFDAHVVHFVDKSFDTTQILAKLADAVPDRRLHPSAAADCAH